MSASKSADKWIRWYAQVVEDTGAPALDPIDSQGRVYDGKCHKCEFLHRHSTNEGGWVCGRCGTSWQFRDVTMFKGEISTVQRPGSTEHRLSKRVDVSTQFKEFIADPRFKWPARVYVANCMDFSIRAIAENGRREWGDGFGEWNYRTVRDAIGDGRQEWTRRMRLIGLLK